MRRGEYHPQVFIQMNMSATSLKPPVSIIIIIGYIYILYTASHVQLAISLDMCIIIIGYSIYIKTHRFPAFFVHSKTC